MLDGRTPGYSFMLHDSQDKTNRIPLLWIALGMVFLMMTGCGGESPEAEKSTETAAEQETCLPKEKELDDGACIAAVCRDIYEEATEEETPDSLEMLRRMVARLDEKGYAAVDSKNQVDMAGADQVLAFCKAVEEKESAETKIAVVAEGEFWIYDLAAEDGTPKIRDTLVSDIAEIKLTEKGCFIYAYQEPAAYSGLRRYWRIKPLSDRCRELTAKYVYGLSYVNYNVLVTDWDSDNVEDILMPCMFVVQPFEDGTFRYLSNSIEKKELDVPVLRG